MSPARIRIILTLLVTLLLSTQVWANHVKCKCPNIDARATGSSSCAASESSGVCTISFNEFDDALEIAARQLIVQSGQWTNIAYTNYPANGESSSPQSFTRANATSLGQQSPADLVDQIMIYSLVALADSGKLAGKAKGVADVHELLRKNAKIISTAFLNEGQRIEGKGLVVQLGCFEFRRDDFWAMYKASWSNAISKEQC